MVTPDKESFVPQNSWQEHIQTERGHFQTLLDYYLLPLVTEIPRDLFGKLRVLSVACGRAYEAVPILKALPGATFKGIDNDSYTISSARRINEDVISRKMKFVEEDAGELSPSEVGRYGLVIVRHPQVFGDLDEAYFNVMAAILHRQVATHTRLISANWRRIFDSTVSKLAPGGYVLATTLDPIFETDATAAYLEDKGVTILTSEENRISRINGFSDQHIILGRKST